MTQPRSTAWPSARLLAIALPAALLLAGCTTTATTFESHGVDAWGSLLEDTPDAYLLDVRTPEEYAEGHIEDADLIPVERLRDRADELPEDTDTPIFVYCRTGSRSAQASEILVDLGYENVHNLEGGIVAWTAAGHPVDQGGPEA